VEEYDVTRAGRSVTAAVLVILVTLLGACTGDEQSGDQPAPDSGAEHGSSGQIDASEPIEITVDGNEVTPNGERLEVERGQTLQFVVTSDRAGEFHVHSTPEQVLSFDEGTTELQLTIDRPGVADMELHDPSVTVLQLEVR
jgi:hypothetical protein